MRRAPPAKPERGCHHERAADHERLEEDVERKPRRRLIHDQIQATADNNRQERKPDQPAEAYLEIPIHGDSRSLAPPAFEGVDRRSEVLDRASDEERIPKPGRNADVAVEPC